MTRDTRITCRINEEAPAPSLLVNLAKGVVMTFQSIPPGCFRMGSRGWAPREEPVNRVRIAHETSDSVVRPFYMGTYPVTQFAAWKPEHENGFPNKPDRPAERVTWDEAMAFCGWLTSGRGREFPPGYVATLPTEAEWEYACRVVATESTEEGPRAIASETEYHTGDGEAALREAGWFDGNSGTETHSVGEKVANGVGLHDMHGKVWEWCWDAYDDDAYRTRVDGVIDPGNGERERWLRDGPSLAASKELIPVRVIRGGSWEHTARDCWSACRFWWRPGLRVWDQGFRVCLVPGPLTEEIEQTGSPGDGAARDAEAESRRKGRHSAAGLESRTLFAAKRRKKNLNEHADPPDAGRHDRPP